MGYLDKTEFQYVWDTINKRFVRLEGSKITDEARYLFRETASEEKDIISPIGEIKSIKGNTIKWNQLCQFEGYWGKNDSDQAVLTRENNVLTETSYKDNYENFRMYYPINNTIRKYYGIAEHKILISYDIKSNKELTGTPYITITYATTDITKSLYKYFTDKKVNSDWQSFSSILEIPSDSCGLETIFFPPTTISSDIMNGDSYSLRNVNIFDLTTMFGAGNEPATVEEFRALFPNSYYEYNTGELKSVNIAGIKTVGFNAFDGELTKGFINANTGVVTTELTNGIISSNSIKVLGGKKYLLDFLNWNDRGSAIIFQYDKDMNFIKRGYGNLLEITTEINTKFIRFYIDGDVNIPTDPQICFHLVHSGIKNGQYEPHWTETKEFSYNTELRGIGTIQDEITSKTKTTKIGIVDLGTFKWSLTKDGYFECYYFTGAVKPSANNVKASILCNKYETKALSMIFDNTDEIGIAMNSSGILAIRDGNITDSNALQQTLSGVMLYYVLVDPIEEEFDIPLDLTYRCEDFGTEEILLAEGSIVPPTVVTEYTHNFLDFTRRLHDLYVAKSNIKTINGSSIIGKGNLDIVPTCPSEDGTYILKATVTNGVATLTWVKEE